MGMSLEQRIVAEKWFRGLSRKKRELLRRVRARDEVVVARYVEPDEAPDDEDGARNLYEYLVNHEILEVIQVFRICTAESAAREVLDRRHLPVAFTCPRSDKNCPMRQLLAQCPGHDVRFLARGDQ